MSELKRRLKNCSRLVLLVIIVAAAIGLVSRNIVMCWNIFLAVLGFSAVVFIHECGHFIVAKLADIKIETFSVFLPPVLLGVRRTENGFRLRILPKFFPKENDPEGEGLLSFTVGKKGKAGETEYRIGLIPVAGYVKMLGQEDIGADKQSDDPRSFSNKSIGVRMLVIVAGVAFNVIAAVGVLMMVYLIGINQVPPVVGGVAPGSPAARAGLKPGDEIIEIAGKSDNLDFGNIVMAAALSDSNEAVEMRVRHQDGTEEYFAIEPTRKKGDEIKRFGIARAQTLTIAEVHDANALFERTGLLAGDQVKAVNGREVRHHWELEQIVRDNLGPSVRLSAQRAKGAEEAEMVTSKIGLDWMFAARYQVESESELYHVCSMVPRLLIGDAKKESGLQIGDIILSVGGVENPTYTELGDAIEEYERNELSIEVLRVDANGVDEVLTVTVKPERPRGRGRAWIGILPVLDAEHPVVAKTITAKDGPERLSIPRGATIVAVAGAEVSDFYDIVEEIRKNSGRSVTISYRVNEEAAGEAVLDVGDMETFVTVKSELFVPFKFMERLYKAEGPLDAFVMGCKKSFWFIAKTYVTLKALFVRKVSLKAMAGPVGIATLTYKAVEHSFVSLMYLLAFISANLAVINFLPIPVVDGGVFILLIVEKIKGAPVNIRVQEIITYAGLVLLGTVIVYISYHDFLRLFFGW
jgi:regulator of sigma E protease